MFKFIVIIGMWPVLPAVAQQQSVVCSSRRVVHTCPADTSNGVLLIQEESLHLCRLGKTWHYDSHGIHVAGGCSATFLVNPRQSNAIGEGGYRTYGSGEDAFHTNSHIGPSGGASQRGVDSESPTPSQQPAAKPR
jgi:hypothetical protein